MPGQVTVWKQIAVSVLLIGAAAFAWHEREAAARMLGLAAAQSGPATVERDEGVPVIVAPVQMAEDDLILEAVGTGRAQRSITLRTETEGKIVSMPMEAAQRYAADDILLRLDDTAERLAVELAQTRLEEAERVRSRFSQLQNSGTTAQARLDEVRTAAEIARIELEAARESLENRVLRAPFDGVVGLSEIEVGDWVDSDVEIATYDDRSVLLVGFDLPEALIGRVRLGLTVTAETPAVPGGQFKGTVTAIDSRIAAASRTARARVAIPNPEDTLRPGASFAVRLELPGDRFPIVPELALQFAKGALYVWRIDGDLAERVQVRLIRRREGNVLVEAPLREADLVVVEGTQRLAPGEPVTIVKTSSGGST